MIADRLLDFMDESIHKAQRNFVVRHPFMLITLGFEIKIEGDFISILF